MKITVVAGCRPEFVKLAPVVAELRRRGESPTIIATGQHQSLLRGTPFENGMTPDVNLGLPGSNDPLAYAATCGQTVAQVLCDNRPDVIVVQGDTASAYAGAWAGAELEIPVAHIEAGIRSGDVTDPFPEEEFRIWIDSMMRRGFCATAGNQEHVRRELVARGGCDCAMNDRAPITGNPGIDTLYSHTKPVKQSQKVDRVLITLHRRESFGQPLREIVSGIHRAAQQYPHLEFVWPLHPNPRVAEALEPQLVNSHQMYVRPENLRIVPPLATVPFARELSTSRAAITDSGGCQEESCALGVPAIVTRTRTDRPESVEIGSARVVGRSEQGVLDGLAWALDTRIEPSHCFGDGHAAPRIVSHLLDSQ